MPPVPAQPEPAAPAAQPEPEDECTQFFKILN